MRTRNNNKQTKGTSKSGGKCAISWKAPGHVPWLLGARARFRLPTKTMRYRRAFAASATSTIARREGSKATNLGSSSRVSVFAQDRSAICIPVAIVLPLAGCSYSVRVAVSSPGLQTKKPSGRLLLILVRSTVSMGLEIERDICVFSSHADADCKFATILTAVVSYVGYNINWSKIII